MENLYSTIFVVDISQNPDEVETVTSRIQQLIEDHGGIIKKIDRWGKRRLAYLIRKKTHGFYVEIEFSANSRLNIPQILEAEFRLNDRVLRHMTYIITAKELAQRARTASKVARREPEPVPAKEPAAAVVETPPVESVAEEKPVEEVTPVETETPEPVVEKEAEVSQAFPEEEPGKPAAEKEEESK